MIVLTRFNTKEEPMSTKHKGRKPGDWVAVARGRNHRDRDDRVSVLCPHGHTAHRIPTKSFLAHLNTCRAGLARTSGAA
jgi:hypothetical protein